MARKVTKSWPWVPLLIFMCEFVTWSSASEADVLIAFKKSLSNVDELADWNQTTNSFPPCTNGTQHWTGIHCNPDGFVDKLVLDNKGLSGMIDIDTLTELTHLRTLSFMGNEFDGPLPEVNKLTSLRNLYLSNNMFSGSISENAFDNMNSLEDLYLANNKFTGHIPRSIVELPSLEKLQLQDNQFGGKLPDFRQANLSEFNVADNHLKGKIPAGLAAKFGISSFIGNKDLCGKPLKHCGMSRKWKTILMICVIAASVVALAAILAFACIGRRRAKNKPSQSNTKRVVEKKVHMSKLNHRRKEIQSPGNHGRGKRGEAGKLNFVKNNRERFDLQDLLRASAEVLGSGNFGSSYKADLLSGPAVVVKRFKQMNNVGKDEFHEHMKRLGRLSHTNLLPLVAFYYRKEEKLLVSDFVENGSLATHLHGKLPPGKQGLDWPTRLKIIKGVARGLAYLYQELPNLTLPHGHLKSSNVLLDHTFEPLLTDYALVPLITKDQAQQVMVAYKAPEFIQNNRPTRKTDVWSLGILILELLTGKFPANYLRQGKGANTDLATWVNSVIREEWTGEVFDMDMRGTTNGEGEMLKLLKIGMCCCEWNVEKRWGSREAVENIEKLKERESETVDFSSYVSEGDHEMYSSRVSEGDHEIYSSRGLTDSDFSFSVKHESTLAEEQKW